MGGNAIKRVSVVRLDKKEYEELGQVVLDRLKKTFPQGDFRIIPAYHQKADFGDLDLLFSFPNPALYEAFHKQAPDILEAADVVKNGDVTSIGMPVDDNRFFQVDLIKSSPDRIDFSMFYFGYNDVGNLMGRIARFLGMKLGHEGLYYTYYPEGMPYQAFREILVTRDIDTVLALLGYVPHEYHESSFDTIDDIFEFIQSSSHMSADIYLSRNQNHSTRKREKTRPINKAFMEYLQEKGRDVSYPSTYEDRDKLRAKALASLMMLESFRPDYEQAEKDYQEGVKFRSLFNGGLVEEWTGLSGKELGKFIQAFRGGLNKGDFQSKIIKMKGKEVKSEVMRFLEACKREKV